MYSWWTFAPTRRKSKRRSKAFDVTVESVNVVNVRGKYKRQGRTGGYTSKGKKAYVTLDAKSKAIPFFETLS